MSGPVTAVVFPGQGTQRAGMGADFHDRFRVARETFEEACDAAGEDLRRICFEPDDRLHRTEYTQACLLATEIAVHRVATDEFGLTAELFGGHSVGEYAALVAAGALPFAEAIRLVRLRGALMQEALPAGQGAMAALILTGIADSETAEIVRAAGAEVANLNSTEQLVISGTAESVAGAKEDLARALPDLTFIPLKVSVPAHSGLMGPVEPGLRARLEEIAGRLRPGLAARVTSNRTGGLHDPDLLVENLVGQVTAPVRWLDNMRELAARAGRVIELGPRPSLTKFFATIGVVASPISTVDEAVAVLAPPAVRRTASGPDGGATAAGAITAEGLGDPSFHRDHEARLAYVATGLGMGVSGPETVIRLGRAGVLGYLGTAGIELEKVAEDVRHVRSALTAGEPWGVSVSHDPHDPGRAGRLIDLLDRLDVSRVEVCAEVVHEPSLVRYRLTGLRHGPDGRPRPARRVLAKVATLDSACAYLASPPPATLRALAEAGAIDREESSLASGITLADDVAAIGGTDLLVRILRSRDDRGPGRARVGLAGGLGTPETVAAAFMLGADFVLTGSVNRCTPEAGLAEPIKDLLAQAGPDDFVRAPDADLFEVGGRLTVLGKGTFFAARARRLYDLFVRHRTLAELPAGLRERIEREYLRAGLDDVWAKISASCDPRGEGVDERARMALLFRWYLTDSLGRTSDPENLQVRGGPALGCFNLVVRDTGLEDWRRRHVDEVAWFLMRAAAGVIDTAMHRFTPPETLSRV